MRALTLKRMIVNKELYIAICYFLTLLLITISILSTSHHIIILGRPRTPSIAASGFSDCLVSSRYQVIFCHTLQTRRAALPPA